jgi:hypothetical protein
MTLPRSCTSPIPAYTTSGLASHTPMAPTEELLKARSDMGRQVVPPSVVFQIPPPVAPNQYSSGRRVVPATAMDLPPRLGPMLRQRKPASVALSGEGAGAGRTCAAAGAAMTRPRSAAAARRVVKRIEPGEPGVDRTNTGVRHDGGAPPRAQGDPKLAQTFHPEHLPPPPLRQNRNCMAHAETQRRRERTSLPFPCASASPREIAVP